MHQSSSVTTVLATRGSAPVTYGSWSKTKSISNAITAIAMSYDGSIMLLGDDVSGKLYKSTDYGATINQVFDSTDNVYLFDSIRMSNDGSIMVARPSTSTNTNVYISIDSGTTWNMRSVPTGHFTVGIRITGDGSTIYVLSKTTSNNYHNILKSTDYGVTWVVFQIGYMGSQVVPDYMFDIDSSGNTLVLSSGKFNTPSIIQISTNGGASFTSYSVPHSSGVCVSGNGNIIYKLSYSGTTIDKSTDFGATWNTYTILSNPGTTNLSGVKCDYTGQKVIVSYDGGNVSYGYPLVSTDYGVTWQGDSRFGDNYHTQCYISGDGNTIIFGAVSGWNAPWIHQISRNGNAPQLLKFDLDWAYIACTMSNTGQYVYAAHDQLSIIRSADYGVTWNYPLAKNYHRYYEGIGVSPTGQYVVVSNTSLEIQYSHDYGVTWNQSVSARRFNRIVCDSSGQIWYGVYLSYNTVESIFKSTDYGVTWSQYTTIGATYITAFDMSSDGQIIYVGTESISGGSGVKRLWRSMDGGVSYTLLSSSLNTLFGLRCSADGSRLILDSASTDSIDVSTDFGASWSTKFVHAFLNSGGNSYSISGDGKTILIIGYNELYVSHNFGKNWMTIDYTNDSYRGNVNWFVGDISYDGNFGIACPSADVINKYVR